MRLPVRSERDAYRITWATVALVAISVVIGAVIHPIAGIAVFAVVVAAALIRDVRAPNPDRVDALHEAEEMGRAGRAQACVLVVANQTLAGEELRAELLGRTPRPELRVVAPILISRTHYAMSDIDAELGFARERLAESLRWAEQAGFQATGEVCPDGPLVAIEDQLRKFAPREVVISTHPPDRSNWLEAGVVEEARGQLDIPVTHVVVGPARVESPA